MQNALNNSTIALAGIAQAVGLIKDLAQTGKMDEVAYETSIRSIFQTNPSAALDVYGDLTHIRYGLEKLIQAFSEKSEGARTTTHYMLSLMSLQKKISRSPKAIQALTQRISQAKKQADYFFVTHPSVIANLADVYMTIIGNVGFRFLLLGNQRVLGVHDNMEKIRALLLAATRSSVLWRQMNGSRFQLIFSRGKIKVAAENMLATIAHSH